MLGFSGRESLRLERDAALEIEDVFDQFEILLLLNT